MSKAEDSPANLRALLKRVVELVMPDLRKYYRVPRKGMVVKSYASDGQYFADVQPLRNDDSEDAREPVIPKVEIPVLWGGPDRGVVCPPISGTMCDITYYDGDPNYPRISNFRWAKNRAPVCGVGEFIIQQAPDVYVKITPSGNIVSNTSADKLNGIGGDKNESVGGDWKIEVAGQAEIVAAGKIVVSAPVVEIQGLLTMAGLGGESGSATLKGNLEVIGAVSVESLHSGGDITADGSIVDQGGNTPNHNH